MDDDGEEGLAHGEHLHGRDGGEDGADLFLEFGGLIGVLHGKWRGY